MTYKTGSVRDFMRWTKRVIADPRVARKMPKRWFDSDATAEKALGTKTSPEAMVKLLSSENLKLLHLIGTRRPSSVRELAMMVRRKESNLSRTLKTARGRHRRTREGTRTDARSTSCCAPRDA